MADVPPEYNLLSLGVKIPIEDQTFDDCWAKAAASLLTFELQLKLRSENCENYKDYRASVQHLVDHVYRDNPEKVNYYKGEKKSSRDEMDNYAATGRIALLYAMHKGVSLDANYKYLGKIDKDAVIPHGPKIKVEKVTSVRKFRLHKIKKIISQGHPMVAHMHVHENFQHFKGKGVYEYTDGKYCGSHIVLVIGFGKDKNGRDYYIIQNSWSKKWGNRGYAKVSCDLVEVQAYIQGLRIDS